MKIKYYFMDEVEKLLDFNEETGKYEKEIGNFKIEVNSWNNKLFIKERVEEGTRDVSEEIIKTLSKLSEYIVFEDEEVEDE